MDGRDRGKTEQGSGRGRAEGEMLQSSPNDRAEDVLASEPVAPAHFMDVSTMKLVGAIN